MNYNDMTEEQKKTWWAAYPAIPDWTEAEENCLVKFLRDADLQGEIRLTGPTSAAQWAYVNMWMNKAGPGVGRNRTYTVESIRERYTTHILPRLAARPPPRREQVESPDGRPTSATSQWARKPLDAGTFLARDNPGFVIGPMGNVLHSTTGAAEMPNYRAVAHLSLLSHDKGRLPCCPSSSSSSSSAGPSAAVDIPNTDAVDGGVSDQSTGASGAAVLDETAEAASALVSLLHEPVEFPKDERKG